MEESSPACPLPIALIVDDDPVILDLLRRMMRLMAPTTSQTIVFAQHSTDALALIQAHEVATILTDYTLDKGNGLLLIRCVKRCNPNAVAILTSGRDQAGLLVGDAPAMVDHFLTKPFSLQEVVRVLGTALY